MPFKALYVYLGRKKNIWKNKSQGNIKIGKKMNIIHILGDLGKRALNLSGRGDGKTIIWM